ncbi:MAG TPA: hypothetical protein VHE81_01820 [Lacipirellulaceae bacterium]|nr:hypothetical protein [Lacipirellulaceae bacterium]
MLWSRDQAREYTEAYLALKAATAEGPRPASRSDDAKLVAAKARFNKSEEQLNRAAALNDYAGTAMVVAGVGLIALLWWLRFSHTGSFDPE